MTPLTDDEKREIVRRYDALRSAVEQDQPDDDVRSAFEAFRGAYRGDSLAFVQAFDGARERRQWVGQLGIYLRDEIEPPHWQV